MKTREINPFGLRLPPEMKQFLEREARANHRSLQAELISRIKMTMEGKVPPSPGARESGVPYGEVLTEPEKLLLGIFRQFSPERQLALLSLFK